MSNKLPKAPHYIVASEYLESARHSLLPPATPWRGGSERFLCAAEDRWITPSERTGLTRTPDCASTIDYLQRLASARPEIELRLLEEPSGEGRDIWMAVVSRSADKSCQGLRKTGLPTVLIEAAIHPGESCGKDAGLMLLRDLTGDGRHATLLDAVNVLFVPILNIDGHERSSPWGRSNQRGPECTGWRSNACNHNLNRDFMKLDSPEIRNIVRVIDGWDPDFFIDAHSTDGANYQYDVTFGHNGETGWSPATSRWMNQSLFPDVYQQLQEMGHLPYVCIDFNDPLDPSAGFYPYYTDLPRFSNGYGDARQTPSLLLEIHSLKPYRQQVLGSYVFFLAVLRHLATQTAALRAAVEADRKSRPDPVPLSFRAPQGEAGQVDFLINRWEFFESEVTGARMIRWSNDPIETRVPVTPTTVADQVCARPRAFYVPRQWGGVIRTLALHGIIMETLDTAQDIEVVLSRIPMVSISETWEPVRTFGQRLPITEGRLRINGAIEPVRRVVRFPAGSVRVPVDQDLGTLAVLLLAPNSPDSLLQWGFFNSVMTQEEGIEPYIMEPMARRMLAESPDLEAEFRARLGADSEFAADPMARLEWFYLRTPFADQNRYLYPVGMEST